MSRFDHHTRPSPPGGEAVNETLPEHFDSKIYLIPGNREPFCHQMGPHQTLRAENWWTQLLVRCRVCFEFKNPEST